MTNNKIADDGFWGFLTLWMRHSLHGRWGDHDGHGNLEPQHCGAQVNASDVHENAGAEPAGGGEIH